MRFAITCISAASIFSCIFRSQSKTVALSFLNGFLQICHKLIIILILCHDTIPNTLGVSKTPKSKVKQRTMENNLKIHVEEGTKVVVL